MMVKVALVRPPDTWGEISDFVLHAPINLMYLAAYIKQHGDVEVKIWDYCVEPLTRETFRSRLADFKPNLVGFTATTSQIKTVGKLAAIVKQVDASIMTVAGGAHVSFIPERSLVEFPALDVIVCFEGEQTLLELCQALQGRKSLAEIPGITYRQELKLRSNPRRRQLGDLDELPFPARDLIDWENYNRGFTTPGVRQNELRAKTIFTQRGCAFNCIFCPASQMFTGVRFRSPAKIEDEVRECMEVYGTRHFTIKDCSFNHNADWVYTVCDIFAKYQVTWDSNVKASLMDEPMMRRMRETGCTKLLIGVESSSPRVLGLIKKQHTPEQIVNFMRMAKANKILVSAYFMIGSHPSETLEEVKATFEFAKKLNPDYIGYSMVIPFPGTELYQIMQDQQYLLNENWDNYVLMTDNPSWRTEHFTPEQLLQLQQWVLSRFHFRPTYILNKLKEIHSPRDLVFFLHAAASLLKMVTRQKHRIALVKRDVNLERPKTTKRGIVTDDL